MGKPETTPGRLVHRVVGQSCEKTIYNFGGKDVLVATGGRYTAESIARGEANAICQHGIAFFHVIEESRYSLADINVSVSNAIEQNPSRRVSGETCHRLTAHVLCASLSKLEEPIIHQPVLRAPSSSEGIRAWEKSNGKPVFTCNTPKDYL